MDKENEYTFLKCEVWIECKCGNEFQFDMHETSETTECECGEFHSPSLYQLKD